MMRGSVLVTEWASRQNVMQRMGRAARTKAGYYFRVCLKEQHVAMQEMPDPEILQVIISGMVRLLQKRLLGRGLAQIRRELS